MEPLGSSVTCQPYKIQEVETLHGLQGKRACTRTVPDPHKYAENFALSRFWDIILPTFGGVGSFMLCKNLLSGWF